MNVLVSEGKRAMKKLSEKGLQLFEPKASLADPDNFRNRPPSEALVKTLFNRSTTSRAGIPDRVGDDGKCKFGMAME